ncbi:MAG: hypothetical protein QNL12_14340 [Acidimicrobiia bacterium]|nr:hypothetical protein [Acidimicrobiia bacterium]MDX2468494.1 hypothetical protein [Acidimicrobiia bacterium]
MNETLVEVIGYAGSALVILSLMQKSILRLRTIGLVASSTFLIYSVAIEAYPIALVNVVAAGIHFYYLRLLVRKKNEVFTILRMRPDSRFLDRFLDFYKDEIANRIQPEFKYEPAPNTLAVFLLRDMVPAGLVVAQVHRDSSFEVLLDFVIPQYRDFKLAKWLYSPESGVFAEANCRCAWTRVTTEAQEEYFTKVGFKPDRTPGVPERYAYTLPS